MKTHLFFSAALSLALFSGCASVQPTITATAKTTSPNDGAFIVRVLPNMASASQYLKNWGEVTVVRLPGNNSEKESSFSISPTLEGTSRTAIYAAPLPEGRYRFGQFSSMMCGYLCINAWLKIKPEFSQFEVKRGTLTDLGVLVQSNNPSDAKNVLLAHDTSENHPETPEIVRELVPGLTSTLANPRISWTPSTVPAEMPRLLAVTLANSYGFVSPQELADEKFLYGSANGVVYSWKLGQRAKPHNLNSRSSIETVLLASDGRWFVGGRAESAQGFGRRGPDMALCPGQLALWSHHRFARVEYTAPCHRAEGQ